jgi:hypothetical protein
MRGTPPEEPQPKMVAMIRSGLTTSNHTGFREQAAEVCGGLATQLLKGNTPEFGYFFGGVADETGFV